MTATQTQHEEYRPSMTSSQIIHPTQDKQNLRTLARSRSFPLLHSAEYFKKFEQFSKDIMIPSNENEEGSQSNYNSNFIPSPPPISNTPEMFGGANNIKKKLINLKNVHPVKSSESVNSSNISNEMSFDKIDHHVVGDGVVMTDSSQIMLNKLIINNEHFIKEKQKTNKRQKQWLKKMIFNEMDSNKNSKNGSEQDWTYCNEAKLGKKKKKNIGDEEDVAFSDWSNVSSNITNMQ